MWQVFNFLFSLIDAEQAKQEFRDCWPILDKKQVAVLVPLPPLASWFVSVPEPGIDLS